MPVASTPCTHSPWITPKAIAVTRMAGPALHTRRSRVSMKPRKNSSSPTGARAPMTRIASRRPTGLRRGERPRDPVEGGAGAHADQDRERLERLAQREDSHDHRGDGRAGHPAREQAQALAPRAARREPRDGDERQGRRGHADEEGGEPVALGVERAAAPRPSRAVTAASCMPKTAATAAR